MKWLNKLFCWWGGHVYDLQDKCVYCGYQYSKPQSPPSYQVEITYGYGPPPPAHPPAHNWGAVKMPPPAENEVKVPAPKPKKHRSLDDEWEV